MTEMLLLAEILAIFDHKLRPRISIALMTTFKSVQFVDKNKRTYPRNKLRANNTKLSTLDIYKVMQLIYTLMYLFMCTIC